MADMVQGHLAIEVPDGVGVWDIDPYDAGVQTDVEPYHRELRARGAFVYLSRYAMLACGRYDVVREVFSDHGRFVSSRGVGLQDFALETPWRPPSIVLEVDPPAHSRTRRAILRALSPKVVADLKSGFLAEARALVARLKGREIDGVADLAEVFPTSVFPSAVGLRDGDVRKLVDYGSMVFNALGPDNAQRQAAMANAAVIGPWIAKACLRENLAQGSIGAAIYASADDGEISEAEAGMLVRSLLSAGVDTTVGAIGNGIWAFGGNPDQFAALRADKKLALGAFEETLRYTSPVAAFCRTAAVDCEVAGISICAGTKILCVLGAANRDPDHWCDADRFDIRRKTVGHLALGVGVHVCVGQNIARAEGQAVLTALGEQVEAVELVGDPVWRANNAIHALARLPVVLR
jgi:cytochrome P450